MRNVKFAALFLYGLATFGLMSCEQSGSQSKEGSRKEEELAAGVQLVDAQFSAQEALTIWLESIKDEGSAKLAMSNFDKVLKKYQGLEEVKKGVEHITVDSDNQKKLKAYHEETMSSLETRTKAAQISAIDALGSNRELLKEMVNKMALISSDTN